MQDVSLNFPILCTSYVPAVDEGEKMAKLTATKVEALRGTKKVKSEPVALGGSLVARGLSDGIGWYYQYLFADKLARCPFGGYTAEGNSTGEANSTAFTLKGARLRAVKLAALQQEHGDLVAYMREQRYVATEALQQSREARKTRQDEARDYSLANLCTAYWKHLETEGKASARDVRNGLRLWVIDKQPALASRKASDVTTEDVLTILRAIIDTGKTTQTNRVRSYLSAAYTFGLGSSTDPLASSRASGFRLTSNPVSPVKRVASFETAGERVLSVDELSALMRTLEAKATPAAKAVTLSLRLGGQRIKQLLAATEHDYDQDNNVLTLKDGKGRRTQARPHALPVVSSVEPLIAEAIAKPHPIRSGLYSGLTMETASKLVREISKEQEAQGAQPYSWRDLRRTCETMLAKMGISKDLRAQIQSHGLSGVQDRHYDKHSYIDEKRAALEAWNARLDELQAGTEVVSNVVRLERKT